MAWFEREFIAVPEDRKNQLIFKWPDVNIRRFTHVLVNADELAVFTNSGRVVGVMGPGRHRVDATVLPGLAALIDTLSGGNAYRAELYFIDTKENPGHKFGGRLGDILDPRSEQIVTLRVFGEYAVAVRDPVNFITGLAGTVGLNDPARIESWCSDLLIRSIKIAVTQGISRGTWPILGLSAFLPDIETEVLRQANQQLEGYGLLVSRIGNMDVTLAPEDADRLKRLAKDMTYIQLAGGFQQYAAGELALGASQGMAHGHGVEGGFLSAGMGLSAMQLGMVQQHQPAQPSPWQQAQPLQRAEPVQQPAPEPQALPSPSPDADAGPGEGAVQEGACAACGTVSPAGARFCMSCGERL